MNQAASILQQIGGEAGCNRLSTEFYKRVGKDPVLRRLFPGKSLRCATEEFGAFLIQFLGGDEHQAQFRWQLSLRQSHSRFRITPAERAAWLKNMDATLSASPFEPATRESLRQFFLETSRYMLGDSPGAIHHQELSDRWSRQRDLDDAMRAIHSGNDAEVLHLVPSFASRPSVFTGLLAHMTASGRPVLIQFVLQTLEDNPSLKDQRFSGNTLLHFAASAGCLPVVTALLRLGADPNTQGRGGHTPLYRVANECGSSAGPDIVRALLNAGADVNATTGVTRATALHMAARRGYVEIARALLDHGADLNARDNKGDTPLQRAINCRRTEVAHLLKISRLSTSL